MKRTELAKALNGLENPIPKDLRAQAAQAGLVIVSGPWATFHGAIEGTLHLFDEHGDSASGAVYFDSRGILPDYEDVDSENETEARAYFDRKRLAAKIDVEMRDLSPDAALWCYTAAFPYSTFTLLDDGNPYCKGIVFSLADAGLHADA